ncbi:MAG TPA: hypothetical protein VJX23_01940 [Candidatus Binataceae bacterium]|nr:hypothetical protein [Candidatus Binataceae bacterium]
MAEDEKKAQGGWIKGGGVTIASDAVLLELKLGGGGEFLDDLMARKIAVAIATKGGIALSDDELDDALAAFYTDRDLFEEAQIAVWLKSMRLREDAVREYVREGALAVRARAILITDDAVADRFGSDRYDYALAEVEVFEFATVGQAREFILAVREKETAAVNGERREVTRREAPEEIAAMLFSCDLGDLAGPVENDDGAHEVFVLRSRIEADLDDQLREQIRTEMFGQLIEAELNRDSLKFLK